MKPQHPPGRDVPPSSHGNYNIPPPRFPPNGFKYPTHGMRHPALFQRGMYPPGMFHPDRFPIPPLLAMNVAHHGGRPPNRMSGYMHAFQHGPRSYHPQGGRSPTRIAEHSLHYEGHGGNHSPNRGPPLPPLPADRKSNYENRPQSRSPSMVQSRGRSPAVPVGGRSPPRPNGNKSPPRPSSGGKSPSRPSSGGTSPKNSTYKLQPTATSSAVTCRSPAKSSSIGKSPTHSAHRSSPTSVIRNATVTSSTLTSSANERSPLRLTISTHGANSALDRNTVDTAPASSVASSSNSLTSVRTSVPDDTRSTASSALTTITSSRPFPNVIKISGLGSILPLKKRICTAFAMEQDTLTVPFKPPSDLNNMEGKRLHDVVTDKQTDTAKNADTRSDVKCLPAPPLPRFVIESPPKDLLSKKDTTVDEETTPVNNRKRKSRSLKDSSPPLEKKSKASDVKSKNSDVKDENAPTKTAIGPQRKTRSQTRVNLPPEAKEAKEDSAEPKGGGNDADESIALKKVTLSNSAQNATPSSGPRSTPKSKTSKSSKVKDNDGCTSKGSSAKDTTVETVTPKSSKVKDSDCSASKGSSAKGKSLETVIPKSKRVTPSKIAKSCVETVPSTSKTLQKQVKEIDSQEKTLQKQVKEIDSQEKTLQMQVKEIDSQEKTPMSKMSTSVVPQSLQVAKAELSDVSVVNKVKKQKKSQSKSSSFGKLEQLTSVDHVDSAHQRKGSHNNQKNSKGQVRTVSNNSVNKSDSQLVKDKVYVVKKTSVRVNHVTCSDVPSSLVSQMSSSLLMQGRQGLDMVPVTKSLPSTTSTPTSTRGATSSAVTRRTRSKRIELLKNTAPTISSLLEQSGQHFVPGIPMPLPFFPLTIPEELGQQMKSAAVKSSIMKLPRIPKLPRIMDKNTDNQNIATKVPAVGETPVVDKVSVVPKASDISKAPVMPKTPVVKQKTKCSKLAGPRSARAKDEEPDIEVLQSAENSPDIPLKDVKVKICRLSPKALGEKRTASASRVEKHPCPITSPVSSGSPRSQAEQALNISPKFEAAAHPVDVSNHGSGLLEDLLWQVQKGYFLRHGAEESSVSIEEAASVTQAVSCDSNGKSYENSVTHSRHTPQGLVTHTGNVLKNDCHNHMVSEMSYSQSSIGDEHDHVHHRKQTMTCLPSVNDSDDDLSDAPLVIDIPPDEDEQPSVSDSSNWQPSHSEDSKSQGPQSIDMIEAADNTKPGLKTVIKLPKTAPKRSKKGRRKSGKKSEKERDISKIQNSKDKIQEKLRNSPFPVQRENVDNGKDSGIESAGIPDQLKEIPSDISDASDKDKFKDVGHSSVACRKKTNITGAVIYSTSSMLKNTARGKSKSRGIDDICASLVSKKFAETSSVTVSRESSRAATPTTEDPQRPEKPTIEAKISDITKCEVVKLKTRRSSKSKRKVSRDRTAKAKTSVIPQNRSKTEPSVDEVKPKPESDDHAAVKPEIYPVLETKKLVDGKHDEPGKSEVKSKLNSVQAPKPEDEVVVPETSQDITDKETQLPVDVPTGGRSSRAAKRKALTNISKSAKENMDSLEAEPSPDVEQDAQLEHPQPTKKKRGRPSRSKSLVNVAPPVVSPPFSTSTAVSSSTVTSPVVIASVESQHLASEPVSEPVTPPVDSSQSLPLPTTYIPVLDEFGSLKSCNVESASSLAAKPVVKKRVRAKKKTQSSKNTQPCFGGEETQNVPSNASKSPEAPAKASPVAPFVSALSADEESSTATLCIDLDEMVFKKTADSKSVIVPVNMPIEEPVVDPVDAIQEVSVDTNVNESSHKKFFTSQGSRSKMSPPYKIVSGLISPSLKSSLSPSYNAHPMGSASRKLKQPAVKPTIAIYDFDEFDDENPNLVASAKSPKGPTKGKRGRKPKLQPQTIEPSEPENESEDDDYMPVEPRQPQSRFLRPRSKVNYNEDESELPKKASSKPVVCHVPAASVDVKKSSVSLKIKIPKQNIEEPEIEEVDEVDEDQFKSPFSESENESTFEQNHDNNVALVPQRAPQMPTMKPHKKRHRRSSSSNKMTVTSETISVTTNEVTKFGSDTDEDAPVMPAPKLDNVDDASVANDEHMQSGYCQGCQDGTCSTTVTTSRVRFRLVKIGQGLWKTVSIIEEKPYSESTPAVPSEHSSGDESSDGGRDGDSDASSSSSDSDMPELDDSAAYEKRNHGNNDTDHESTSSPPVLQKTPQSASPRFSNRKSTAIDIEDSQISNFETKYRTDSRVELLHSENEFGDCTTQPGSGSQTKSSQSTPSQVSNEATLQEQHDAAASSSCNPVVLRRPWQEGHKSSPMTSTDPAASMRLLRGLIQAESDIPPFARGLRRPWQQENDSGSIANSRVVQVEEETPAGASPKVYRGPTQLEQVTTPGTSSRIRHGPTKLEEVTPPSNSPRAMRGPAQLEHVMPSNASPRIRRRHSQLEQVTHPGASPRASCRPAQLEQVMPPSASPRIRHRHSQLDQVTPPGASPRARRGPAQLEQVTPPDASPRARRRSAQLEQVTPPGASPKVYHGPAQLEQVTPPDASPRARRRSAQLEQVTPPGASPRARRGPAQLEQVTPPDASPRIRHRHSQLEQVTPPGASPRARRGPAQLEQVTPPDASPRIRHRYSQLEQVTPPGASSKVYHGPAQLEQVMSPSSNLRSPQESTAHENVMPPGARDLRGHKTDNVKADNTLVGTNFDMVSPRVSRGRRSERGHENDIDSSSYGSPRYTRENKLHDSESEGDIHASPACSPRVSRRSKSDQQRKDAEGFMSPSRSPRGRKSLPDVAAQCFSPRQGRRRTSEYIEDSAEIDPPAKRVLRSKHSSDMNSTHLSSEYTTAFQGRQHHHSDSFGIEPDLFPPILESYDGGSTTADPSHSSSIAMAHRLSPRSKYVAIGVEDISDEDGDDDDDCPPELENMLLEDDMPRMTRSQANKFKDDMTSPKGQIKNDCDFAVPTPPPKYAPENVLEEAIQFDSEMSQSSCSTPSYPIVSPLTLGESKPGEKNKKGAEDVDELDFADSFLNGARTLSAEIEEQIQKQQQQIQIQEQQVSQPQDYIMPPMEVAPFAPDFQDMDYAYDMGLIAMESTTNGSVYGALNPSEISTAGGDKQASTKDLPTPDAISTPKGKNSKKVSDGKRRSSKSKTKKSSASEKPAEASLEDNVMDKLLGQHGQESALGFGLLEDFDDTAFGTSTAGASSLDDLFGPSLIDHMAVPPGTDFSFVQPDVRGLPVNKDNVLQCVDVIGETKRVVHRPGGATPRRTHHGGDPNRQGTSHYASLGHSNMGMHTCHCGAQFTDHWSYQDHEVFCNGPQLFGL